MHRLTPYLPIITPELTTLAELVISSSAERARSIPPTDQYRMVEQIWEINAKASNEIEGEGSEEAIRAHIECQRQINGRLKREPNLDPSDPECIRWVHAGLFDGGGAFRQKEVQVGRHLPPRPEKVPEYLERFHQIYCRDQLQGTKGLIAIASAHHRLLWIHPFRDGNGRVTRLFTDTGLRIAVPGAAYWSLSQGLASSKDQYMAALDAADSPRQGDLDGRGNLSEEGLRLFCRFFLETCVKAARL